MKERWWDSSCEEPLYDASPGSAEHTHLLSANGFEVRAHIVNDPECGAHTVWLATYQ